MDAKLRLLLSDLGIDPPLFISELEKEDALDNVAELPDLSQQSIDRFLESMPTEETNLYFKHGSTVKRVSDWAKRICMMQTVQQACDKAKLGVRAGEVVDMILVGEFPSFSPNVRIFNYRSRQVVLFSSGMLQFLHRFSKAIAYVFEESIVDEDLRLLQEKIDHGRFAKATANLFVLLEGIAEADEFRGSRLSLTEWQRRIQSPLLLGAELFLVLHEFAHVIFGHFGDADVPSQTLYVRHKGKWQRPLPAAWREYEADGFALSLLAGGACGPESAEKGSRAAKLHMDIWRFLVAGAFMVPLCHKVLVGPTDGADRGHAVFEHRLRNMVQTLNRFDDFRGDGLLDSVMYVGCGLTSMVEATGQELGRHGVSRTPTNKGNAPPPNRQ